jgi:glutathione S-transferase
MAGPIIFYDISNTEKTAQKRAWSPNTWKTRHGLRKFKVVEILYGAYRYSLGFKGLPFKTVWVEYPDIAHVCQSIGAEPTGKLPDGSPYYSLPVIQDPSTGKVIADSWKIAEYLDATYPDRPTLIPRGTHALQWAFLVAIWTAAADPIADLMQQPTCARLAPASQAFFRRTREERHGCKVEDMSAGAQRVEHWKTAEAGLGRIGGWLEKGGEGSRWVMGDVVTFADFALAGWIVWARQVADSEEWEKVAGWGDGRWVRFIVGLNQYATYDEGEVYQR